MLGWETLLAAIVGLAVGGGAAAVLSRQRERRSMRARVEIETRLRRMVVPVLERRADALGIPPAERGADDDGPIELAVTLAKAIRSIEESADLPFGDTVEVARRELDRELEERAGRGA